MLALASQFDKDALGLVPSAVRCGFEAEFASSVERPEVAERLATILDIPVDSVNVSNRHGASHNSEYATWSVESDGSVPVDRAHPVQIEIVSPVLDYNEMLESMESVFEIIKDIGLTSQGADVGSNDSTGLHITFSSDDLDLNSIDPLKLVLLLGEHYYAQMFGRENAGYAASVVQSLEESIGSGEITPDAIRDYVSNPADGEIHDIVWKGLVRTLSVNFTKVTRSGVVEFRLPGGKGYEHKFSKIAAVAKRFVHAMYAACNPDMYKEVYAKKLFKMVSSSKEAVVQQRTADMLADDAVIKSRIGDDGQTELYTVMRTPTGIKRVDLASLLVNNGAILEFTFGLNTSTATAQQLLDKLFGGKIDGVPALDAITLMYMYSSAVDAERPLQQAYVISERLESYFSRKFAGKTDLDDLFNTYYEIAELVFSRYHKSNALPLLKYVIMSYLAPQLVKTVTPPVVDKDDKYIKYVLPVVAIIKDAEYHKVFGVGDVKPSFMNKLSFLGTLSGQYVTVHVSISDVASLYLKAGRLDLVAKLAPSISMMSKIPDLPAEVFKTVRAATVIRDNASSALMSLADVKDRPNLFISQYLRKAKPADLKALTSILVEQYLEDQDGLGSSWTSDTGIPYIDKAIANAFSSALTAARSRVATDGVGNLFLRRQRVTITDYACIEAMTESDLENYVKHGAELNQLVGEIARSFRDTPMPKSDVVYDFALFCATNIIEKLALFNAAKHNGAPTLGRDLATWYNDLYKDPVRLALLPGFKKIALHKLVGFFARNLPASVFYNDNLYAFLSALGRGRITPYDSTVLLGILTDNGEKAVPAEIVSNPAFLQALSGFEDNKELVAPSGLVSTLPSNIKDIYKNKKLHPTVLALRLGKKKKLEAAKQGEG